MVGPADGCALGSLRRFYKHAHFLPEPRDVIRHVRDLVIATFNSQTACQLTFVAEESNALLHFGETPKNCADLGQSSKISTVGSRPAV
jgi:hypothetical protein